MASFTCLCKKILFNRYLMETLLCTEDLQPLIHNRFGFLLLLKSVLVSFIFSLATFYLVIPRNLNSIPALENQFSSSMLPFTHPIVFTTTCNTQNGIGILEMAPHL